MTKYFKQAFATKGDKAAIADALQTDGEVSYEQGFGYDYQRKLGSDSLAKPIPRQQTNQLYYDITTAIKQYQENGFFDFISPEMNNGESFSYALAACVRYDISDAKDGSDIRIFSSKIHKNTGNPKDNPDDWSEVGKTIGAGYAFITINKDTALTTDKAGIILIDASSNDIVVSLPQTKLAVNYTLKRIDNSEHKVKIQTSGTDKIKYNMNINANGYSFFYLFGAGDYWQLVGDGNGSWFDLDRKDKATIGDIKFNTSSITPIGGYLLADGCELLRADYPFFWDYAQYSGLLVADAEREGKEGCFTTADGATTFKLPDLRGEFLRVLDNGRGIDPERKAGNWQADDLKKHSHKYIGAAGISIIAYPGSLGANPYELDSKETGGDETRPRNIAYPTYIKII